MNKPQRIDYKRNEFVGGVILQKARWATGTGQTESEYCTAGDFYIDTLEGRIEVENKTVNKEFNSKYLYPFHNNNWYCLPQGLDPGRKYWMLNALNPDGTLGKGLVMRASDIALTYLFRDGILWFNPQRLREATECGVGIYRTTQRTEFESEKRKQTYQPKILVDLSMGVFIPCIPPEELFAFSTHEDFNKNNRKG